MEKKLILAFSLFFVHNAAFGAKPKPNALTSIVPNNLTTVVASPLQNDSTAPAGAVSNSLTSLTDATQAPQPTQALTPVVATVQSAVPAQLATVTDSVAPSTDVSSTDVSQTVNDVVNSVTQATQQAEPTSTTAHLELSDIINQVKELTTPVNVDDLSHVDKTVTRLAIETILKASSETPVTEVIATALTSVVANAENPVQVVGLIVQKFQESVQQNNGDLTSTNQDFSSKLTSIRDAIVAQLGH